MYQVNKYPQTCNQTKTTLLSRAESHYTGLNSVSNGNGNDWSLRILEVEPENLQANQRKFGIETLKCMEINLNVYIHNHDNRIK